METRDLIDALTFGDSIFDRLSADMLCGFNICAGRVRRAYWMGQARKEKDNAIMRRLYVTFARSTNQSLVASLIRARKYQQLRREGLAP